MRKIEVLVEANTLSSARSVEVVADAQVAELLPVLVEALQLPPTDLFGKKLIYTLCQSGRALPENSTLRAAGVRSGTRLALDSHTLDSLVGPQADPDFHSSETIVDGSLFTPASPETPTSLPPLKKEHRWTRRMLLLSGGAILGALGVGAGYAAYNTYVMQQPAAQQPMQAANQPKPPAKQPLTTAKLESTFALHTQTVRTVAWSSSGTMLASGADDGLLIIWSANGNPQRTLRHNQPLHSVAWAPDSQRLAGAAGNQLIFYSALNGKQLANSGRRHTQIVNSVAWSSHAEMRVVSGSADRHAIVWNPTTYRPVTTFNLHTTAIDTVAWTADGQSVASASQGGAVRVWSAGNGAEWHGYYQINAVLHALAWSPTATQLAAAGNDGVVYLWNNALACQVQRGNGNNAMCNDIPMRLNVSRMPVRALAWSLDGRYLAVGADDGMFSLWDLTRPQKPLLTVRAAMPVHALAWSPDSKKIALAAGPTVTTWALM